MKTITPLLSLAFLLLGSSLAVAETVMIESSFEKESPITLLMSSEESQRITNLCTEIADTAGLKNELRYYYIEQCTAVETMVTHDPEAPIDTTETVVHILTN